MRAISSVVDVSVFLLLVSAAVATLVFAPGAESPHDPVEVDDDANLLATVTADPSYELRGRERRAHGTVASLLARGAVANTSIDGRVLADGDGEFLQRVREVTRQTLGPANRTVVVARWAPYRGSPVQGTVQVGTGPPPGPDVTVATLAVPAPAGVSRHRAAEAARTGGFGGVASVLAGKTARTLLPESRASLPSTNPAPASDIASDRFRTVAEATGVPVSGHLSEGDVAGAHRRAVRGLAATYEADMRDRFATPRAAAAALDAGTVRITLRRWDQ